MSIHTRNEPTSSAFPAPPKLTENQLEHFRGQARRNRNFLHLLGCVFQLHHHLENPDQNLDELARKGISHRIDELLMEIAVMPAPDEAALQIKLDFFAVLDAAAVPGNLNLLSMLGTALEMDIRRLRPSNPRFTLRWTVH